MERTKHASYATDHSQHTERTKLISHPSSSSYLTYFPAPPHVPPRSPSRLLISRIRIKIKRPRNSVGVWIGDAGFDLRLQARPRTIGWRDWGREEISGDALVLPLLIVTFSCALADSITLQRYSTFATSMTGNTVLLAIRMMGSTEKSPLLAGVSLLGFVVSGLISGQVGAIIGHSRRDWLMFNFLVQIGILCINVLLVSRFASPVFQPEGRYGWVYLLLLAVQGGIQVTQAANSGARELPTAMMTTPYAALISDPSLFSSGKDTDVRSRNRRVLYIIVFWLGAFCGAALHVWVGIGWATGAVLGCMVVVVGLIAFLRGRGGRGDGDQIQGGEEERDLLAYREISEDEHPDAYSNDSRHEREEVDNAAASWNTALESVQHNISGGPSPRRLQSSKDRTKVLSGSGSVNAAKEGRRSDMSPPTLDRRHEEGRRESRDERNVAM